MLIEKIAFIEKRYNELNQLLEESGEDYQRAVELAKERSEIEDIYNKASQYRSTLARLEEARALLDSEDDDLRELATLDYDELQPQLAKLEQELKMLLVPRDPRDDKNVILEIRAGTGGDEAGLFVADLYRMYTRYGERRGWTYEILSANETGIGGFKEIIFSVKGKGAYSRLKYESGVHRVQRIPVTESSGRIHTSTITVAVMAEVEDVDIDIPASDVRIDIFKSAGAGGQNVQKNETAVRLTHVPTGIVVACQDERSQLQNRLRAMAILRARLFELEVARRQAERVEDRRSQVGSGERAEKIRTYNYPQNRVTDHRVNKSSFNLPGVMDGDLDDFIDDLSIQDETERLNTQGDASDD